MSAATSFWEQYGKLIIAVGVSFLVFLFFWILGCIWGKKITPKIEKRVNKEKHNALSILVEGFSRPLALFFKVAGLCTAVLTFTSIMPNNLPAFFSALPEITRKIYRITSILAISWGLVSSSQISTLVLWGAKEKLDLKTGKSVTHFLSAIFKVVVIAITVVILLAEFQYDVNGLIAGLGLGGLTIALAAKDSAENFFGGLVLVLEKPFEIGDWIACGDVEGTVEDINLRSTKIRTGPGALTTMPNAKLSSSAITNWSGGMEKRRANFSLLVTYSTPKNKLTEYTQEIRKLLESDPEILAESVFVRFADFGESGLEIKIAYYTNMSGFADHMKVKERINYSLMELAEKHDVEFAFPTRTLFLEKK